MPSIAKYPSHVDRAHATAWLLRSSMSTHASEPSGEGDVSKADTGLQLMRGRLLERMFGEVDAKPRIDRFELLEELGQGAMGKIYRAHDPKLGREVALKIVRAEVASEAATRRMLREARGLASLSHPNVVSVFEVGPAPVGIWIAMEYVPGQTLRNWLEQPHRWQDRLAMLIAAGRGLAAAHAAGLVHRDFKPDNVMVGLDGRARVLDFGLAESIEARAQLSSTIDSFVSESSSRPGSGAELEQTLEAASRATGGTPSYMAPEAFSGEDVGPHTDQWAYCVTLYEALTGRRPFVGSTLAQLMECIHAESPADLGRKTGVPDRVAAAISRGLAKQPRDRWPDMNALLDELEKALSGRRRRLAAAGLSLIVGIAAGSLTVARVLTPPQCVIDTSALAGVWDEAKRDALHVRFAATELEFAERSLTHVEAALDDWAAAWVVGQQQACEATRVLGVASEALLDQRSACFARKRGELRAIVELLLAGDAEVVANSPELVAQLPRLADCSDPQLLESRFPVPPDQASAIQAAYERITEIRALAKLGRLPAAKAELLGLELTAGSIDYVPLALELRALEGEQASWHYDYDRAVDATLVVVREAEGLQLDQFVARQRVWLADSVAATWGNAEREAWLVDDAAAAVARLGREPGPLDVDLLCARGRLYEREGHFDDALERFTEAAELAVRLGDLMRQTQAELAIARIDAALGRNEAASARLDEIATVITERLGPGAPMLASIELDRALLATQRGAFEQAQGHVDRAQAIYADVFGPHSVAAARADLAAGQLALNRGDFDEAERAFTRATRAGVRATLLANAHEALGVVYFYRGDFRTSVSHYRRALALRQQQVGDEHPELAILYSNIGESLAALHEYDTALEAFVDCLAILERKLPADHPDLAFPLKGRGQVRLALGSAALAAVDLERALALHEKHPGEPLERADVEFSLARALAELGEWARAEALARSAQARYLDLNQSERANDIASWLTIHSTIRRSK